MPFTVGYTWYCPRAFTMPLAYTLSVIGPTVGVMAPSLPPQAASGNKKIKAKDLCMGRKGRVQADYTGA